MKKETGLDFYKRTQVNVYGKNMLWNGKVTPDMTFPSSQSYHLAVISIELIPMLNFWVCKCCKLGQQDQIKLFILSLSLIYLYFEKAMSKAKTITPK